MTIDPGWPVAIALVLLLAIALTAHRVAGTGLELSAVTAALRATLQLGVVSLVIAAVVRNVWLSLLFSLVMFVAGVFTTAKRIDAPGSRPWAAVAMAAGILPVVAVVLATRTIPFEGIALIPVLGIIIGNAMTGHTLVGRRAFAALREERGDYEAGLSIGLLPSQAIREVIHRRTPEALIPGLDQTRTTGLVTLPGAFIGVMLGGGSAVQAGTAQLLVLIGIMAAQTVTAAVEERLIAARRIIPDDLRPLLHD
ncbi:ABC transporter permease [Actinomycetota bacterium]